MSNENIRTLVERIDKLTRVIAINAIKDLPPQQQVGTLDGLGFTQTEIAAFTGMSQGNVSKILKKLHGGASPARSGDQSTGEKAESGVS